MFFVDEVTVADADTYFANRLNADAWKQSQEKLAALTTASTILSDFGDWLGRPMGPYPFPAIMPGYNMPVTPLKVKWALYEQALHLLVNPAVLNEEEAVESVVLGPAQLDKITPVPLIPKIVYRLLGPYVSSGQTWWRAN